MAGSWGHIVDDEGRFIGVELIENLGDAWEVLEECYGMVHWLAKGDPALVEAAAKNYRVGIALSPGVWE